MKFPKTTSEQTGGKLFFLEAQPVMLLLYCFLSKSLYYNYLKVLSEDQKNLYCADDSIPFITQYAT